MSNEPITREEMLLSAVATGEAANVKPITREEMFLAKLGGADVNTPTPITRKEQFLQKAIEVGNTGGGGGGGGSSASVPWNDVTFIDYDGTVLHSYSLAEAQALTELPPLPEQKGLICQGWNWNLEDIKAQNGPVIVGAMYITDDGKTRIYITLQEGRTSPMLGVCPNGTVTVDWGDGTEPDVLTGTSTSTMKWTPTHKYASAGDYVISLSVDGEMEISGMSNYSYLLKHDTTSTHQKNRAYLHSVQKIEVGDGVTIGNNAFANLGLLKSINLPAGITATGQYAFAGCYTLASINLPCGVPSINVAVFSGCNGIVSISLPASVTRIENNALNGLFSLANISLPNGVTYIGECANLRTLASIRLPSGLESIGNYAFNNCHSVRYYDFSRCTTVPTLEGTSVFNYNPDDCQMLIPAALFDEWSTATNWATYASYMVAV